ncbi:prepilin peptidase [Pseudonocardia pini]|uniref:prepilin peptidase n=1 Tax=Pseudonocardia pini TaxID=2758030 RepID=UPI0015F0583A|nr:A24 family peptidase [Pseudonocardia pini]
MAGGAAAGLVPVEWVPLLLGAAWLGVVAGVVDVRHHRLPDVLTLPAFPTALALAVPLGWGAAGRALAGGAVLVAVHLAVHAVSPAALGLGDVKLAATVGAVLAADSWAAVLLGCAVTAVFSGVLGAVLGIRALVRVRRTQPNQVRRPCGRHACWRQSCGSRVSEGCLRAAAARDEGAGRQVPHAVDGSAGFLPVRGAEAVSRPGGDGRPTRAPAGVDDAVEARARDPAAARSEPALPTRATELPHGPSMLAAAWLTAFAVAVGGRLSSGLTGVVGVVGVG